MRVIDPGHKYELNSLDGDELQTLTFVKREGDRFPGNVGHYPGTIMQEVIRALIDRCEYVNNQTECLETEMTIGALKQALVFLEIRASRVHDRYIDFPNFAEFSKSIPCSVCGHLVCTDHEII